MADQPGNFLAEVRNLISTESIDKVSGQLGEAPINISRGLTNAIPAVLGGLATLGSHEAGAENVIGMIQRSGLTEDGASDLGEKGLSGFSTGNMADAAQNLLNTIFGDKVNAVAQTVAESSGLRKGSAKSLMTMVVPFLIKAMNERAGGSIDVPWLRQFFGEQKTYIATALPGLGPLLSGVTGVTALASNNLARIGQTTRSREEPTSKLIWILPVAAAVLLALGGLWLYQRNPETKVPAASTAEVTERLPQVDLTLPDIDLPEVALPDGNEQLSTFLENLDPAELPKAVTFANVNFVSGSAELVPESVPQVEALADTLNSHPGVNIRIEGHTDGVGDVAANKQLSLGRAIAVRSKLAQRGVEPSRVDVVGVGDDMPVAANETESGRADNRRIEVVVLSVGPQTVAH